MSSLDKFTEMSAPELEAFLATARDELRMTFLDEAVLRCRRRRRSLERHAAAATESAEPSGLDTTAPLPVKVVVLGDDTPHKLRLLGLLTRDGAATTDDAPLHAAVARVTAGGEERAVEVWGPPCDTATQSFRGEVLQGADAVVIAYGVADRASFEATREAWGPMAQRHADQWHAACGRDVPITVVGLGAEVRSAASNAVPAVEAVQLAQDLGAAKYMEAFDGNGFHATELLVQVTATVVAARAATETVAEADGRRVRAAAAAQTCLRPATPAITYDTEAKTVALSAAPDAAVFYALDDGAPTAASRRYAGPVSVGPGCTVRAVACARSLRPSPVAEYTVPGATPCPEGFVDPATRQLYLSAVPGAELRYTVDGTAPTAASLLYTGPAALNGDADECLRPWVGDELPLVRAVATKPGCLPSDAADVPLPPLLPPPMVHYGPGDRSLRIDPGPGTPPGLADLRYTVDGTAPTLRSALYIRPVMLPPSVECGMIRAAAFPRLWLASAVAEATAGAPGSGRGGPAIATTRTATLRAADSHAARDAPHQDPMHVAPGSRHATPRYRGSPRRREESAPRHRTPRGRSGTPRRRAKGTDPAVEGAVTQSDTVRFKFDAPVSLSHITVATPGGAQGPASYEVHAVLATDGPGEAPHVVGQGSLDDVDSVQTLQVTAEARRDPVVAVECVFRPLAEGGPLEVSDLKVHGKLFQRH